MTAISAEGRTSRVGQALVALGLAAGPVVALGFTRFAYALLLPPMHRELHWSYAQAGGMNTANALGYILGAASAAFWARRSGGRSAFLWSLAISAVALLATAGHTARNMRRRHAKDHGCLLHLPRRRRRVSRP
ncbi:YbfB/YjiJ family MFS transporter, partial [Nonomuraea dietziae]|uniref:YbfB/YjiJ family MFS transporter n=1 Tax=Nonomuraea dietziae TaxID=65515 RepID=UPI00342B4B3E